jgi:2,3-diaminopropionate biosynthesis protein SbnA
MTDAVLWERIEAMRRELPSTDLVRLPHPSMELYAKMELANPGGSAKDRAAYWILREAVRRGDITRRTTVVESSSGNFALSLSWMCARLGIQLIPVLDPNVNRSTEQALRETWDRVEKVEGPVGAGGFLLARLDRVADVVKELDDVYWPDQYSNVDGLRGHFEMTGAELVAALPTLNYLFVGISTGATIAGLSQRVSRDLEDVSVIAVDVAGSVILGGPPQRRHIPGIGSSIRPPLIDQAVMTDSVIVSEQEEVAGCHDLLREHGVLAGGSTGCVYAAINRYFAGWQGPPPVVAFLCADSGTAYRDTVYDPAWVRAHRLSPGASAAAASVATPVTDWTSPPAEEAEFLAWLDERRERAPVQCSPKQDGWHVFGYAESMAVLADHAAFSSEPPNTLPPESAFQLFRSGNLSWMDPPRHRQLRALVGRVFTPRYVAGLARMVEATVEEYLSAVRGRPRFEYVNDYASPVVATVVARMVGIPPKGQELFRQWSADLLALIDPRSASNVLGRVAGRARLISAYLHEYLGRRRNDPKDDLASALTRAEVDGERLSDDEVVGLIALLLSTGQAATLTLVNAMIVLDQHPEAMARLRGDISLLGPAIEEVMRFRNQTTRVARQTVKEATVGGHTIPAGQPVTVWLAAANRDRSVFEQPDLFRLDRAPNPHLALGHGIHYCLGAALARQEIDVAMRRILEQTSHLSVDYEASRLLDPRLIFGASELTITAQWTGEP